MQIPSYPHAHLTYCLNVHPGETVAAQLAAIREHAVPIRAQVAPGVRFGLGLRLAGRAALELESALNRQALQALLGAHGLYAFTINGFPFGAFHGAAVKEDVYRPDWREAVRCEYTCRLARTLAAILPEGMTGSISTVPGSYKAWIRSADDVSAMVVQLADTAACLDGLRRETGREIHLGLEPEPDCFLETTAESIAFFRDHLLPQGSRRLVETRGGTRAAAEEIIRRHIGVCFDTCHLSLQFESPGDSLRKLAASGIRISKIQISAALRTGCGPEAAAALRPFCDSVYLHQVKARAGGRIVSRGDLADALASSAVKPGEEWRVHCHVPLYFPGDGLLASTADLLDPDFFRAALDLRVEHFEIETYTFDVLPEPLRRLGIDRSIAEEFRWVLSRFAAGRAEGALRNIAEANGGR